MGAEHHEATFRRDSDIPDKLPGKFIACKFISGGINLFLAVLAVNVSSMTTDFNVDLLDQTFGKSIKNYMFSVFAKIIGRPKLTYREMMHSNMTLRMFIEPTDHYFVVFSYLILILSISGMVALYLQSKKLYRVYFVVLAVSVLVQLIVVIAASTASSMFVDVKASLLHTLQNYSGFEGTDDQTRMWNGFMLYYNCCGVDSSRDFRELKYWKDEEKGLMMYAPHDRRYQPLSFKAPAVCCMPPYQKHSMVPDFFHCITDSTGKESGSRKGCWVDLVGLFRELELVGPLMWTPIILEAILLCFIPILMEGEQDEAEVTGEGDKEIESYHLK